MLTFYSASVRIANSVRAVDECMEMMFGERVPADCGVFIVNAAMGHRLEKVAAAIKTYAPDACVFGTSCGGVVGREGAGEAMTNLAMMAISGPKEEFACARVDGICAANAYDKGRELSESLREQLPGVRMIYMVSAGLEINCDLLLKAVDDVFGGNIPVFGGTSADNYKAITTWQYVDDHATEHGAWMVGFADPTLHMAQKATHGFCAYGEPMTVTKSQGNRLIEIDGVPAWAAYANRLSLMEGDPHLAVLAAGALASELPADLAAEYGNPHILRGAVQGKDADGIMHLSVSVSDGERFWLTTRDEDLIFSEQEKALDYLIEQLAGRKPVAVFQADCLARGRTLFDRVMKDELIGMMHSALAVGDEVPPWLGMYGFGEFCLLGEKNTFHTYTTSLLVLYR